MADSRWTTCGNGGADAAPFKTLDGLFRINTDVSAGRESLSAVADKAVAKGLDFIVVSDQFLVRAEYGLPPFRNALKVWRTRKSVSTLGIEKYLAEIAAVDKARPELIVVPGVDVAPHYFWTGSPFSGLTIHQFSRQLTVFGSKDPDFYRRLPVIHNEPAGFFFPHTVISLLPLLLAFAGIAALARKKIIYKDVQGNEYRAEKRWPAKVAAALLALTGILWTLNNQPFAKPGFAQYADNGGKACQALVSYVEKRRSPHSEVGVFWSAPEARSSQRMAGVALVTEKYVEDVLAVRGSDGFAGIYADTSTERRPGSFWDAALREYISGKRGKPLFIVGERDYHGQSRAPFDYIKTVALIPKRKKNVSMEDVVDAITHGHTYAVCKTETSEIRLDDVELVAETADGMRAAAVPGGTLEVPRGSKVSLRIAGHLEADGSAESAGMALGRLVVVLDGARLAELKIKLKRFRVETAVSAVSAGTHYVRFHIDSDNRGRIVCNPIFISSAPRD